jgi:hypothetical protein
MHLYKTSFLIAAVLVGPCLYEPQSVKAQPAVGVRVRVDALKRSTFEREAAGSPVLVGPQSGIELEGACSTGPARLLTWRLRTGSSGCVSRPGGKRYPFAPSGQRR